MPLREAMLTAMLIVSPPLARGEQDEPPKPPLRPSVANSPGHRVEEVRFRSGENTLAGWLILPDTPGPHPAIAFVLGSDPADRTYYGMAPHLWQHFARHGFACLAWDKPGVGKSTRDYNAQTIRDRADEALAAVRFLRGRAEIARDRVGIWGHSKGGAVAPLAASLSGDVAFLIEVGGSQVVAWQQDAFRVEAELRIDGFPEADIRDAVAFPGADHGLKTTVTGGPKEARERSRARKSGDGPDFAPGYLDLTTDWLTRHFGP
jgi:dipeptidyl aminopeptidase/acylaminoacyl peptidase